MPTFTAPTYPYIEIFKALAEHTAPKCGSCRAAYICCTAEQCGATRDFAHETFGITLEQGNGPVPFLGPEGCTVPPHLRPLCTVHVCEQHITDDAWSAKYEDLREQAGDALKAEMDRVFAIT